MLSVGWGLFSRHVLRGTLAFIPEALVEIGGVQADRADAPFAESARHCKAGGKEGPSLPDFIPGAVFYQIDHRRSSKLVDLKHIMFTKEDVT